MRLLLDLQKSVKSEQSFECSVSNTVEGCFEMSPLPDFHHNPQLGAVEINANADLILLMGRLPVDKSIYWMSWNDLMWK